MKNSFEKNDYLVIKNFIPKELCSFAKVYFKIRQDTLEYDIDFNCPDSKSFYGDTFCETLLLSSCKKISDVIGVDLAPTYSYTIIYTQGNEHTKNKRGSECQYSAVLCLGNPQKQKTSPIYFSKYQDGKDAIEIFLNEGDLCVYKGDSMWYWREPIEQSWHLQTFLNYVDLKGPYISKVFDERRCLGISKG